MHRRTALGSAVSLSPTKSKKDAPETGRNDIPENGSIQHQSESEKGSIDIHRPAKLKKKRLADTPLILRVAIWIGAIFVLVQLSLSTHFFLPSSRSSSFPISLPLGPTSSFDQSNLFGRSRAGSSAVEVPVRFQTRLNVTSPKSQFHMPPGYIRKSMYYNHDFGGLSINFYTGEDDVGRRLIARNLKAEETHFRDPNTPLDDDMDIYYYFDDDNLRGMVTDYDDHNKHNDSMHCRRVADHYLHFPTCNLIHEIDRTDTTTEIKYLNKGAFRQVFRVSNHLSHRREFVVIKDIRYDLGFAYDEYEYVRMDAIVAERLTASPRIYDIYGHCGLGIMSEYFFHGDIEKDAVYNKGDGYISQQALHDEDEVKPQNNYTGIEKLALATEMSEALADLHGFESSMIIHNDVQMSQFLLNYHKSRLKFNDFNRAEMPLFDQEQNRYCRYKSGHGHGTWRSPEEYKDQPLTEQIDIWSLGCNFYALLTGLNPLYNVSSTTKHQEKIMNGEKPFIDPRYHVRSPAEDWLANITIKCFEFEPKRRPTIFQLVKELRHALHNTLPEGVTKAQVLEKIKTSK